MTIAMPLTRNALLNAGHRYLDALAEGAVATLEFTSGALLTQNCQPISIADGLLGRRCPVRYRYLVADPETQQVAVFAVVEEDEALSVFGSRLAFEGGAIREAETLVCRKGESSVFDPKRLVEPNPLFDAPIAEDERQSRHELVDYANRYFDGIELNSAARVPFHVECNRTENGVRTTNRADRPGSMGCAEQFDRGFFGYIESMRERRFPIVDTERGLVWGIAFLDVPGTVTHLDLRDGRRFELPERMRHPRSTLLFELFKVAGGQLREIEAFMVNLPYGTTSGWRDVKPSAP
ncbi:MAG: hypothetical protein OXU20_41265 [Myxococcales bacterium]|nr:hypothetical protein [Myxococcales bacterium]